MAEYEITWNAFGYFYQDAETKDDALDLASEFINGELSGVYFDGMELTADEVG